MKFNILVQIFRWFPASPTSQDWEQTFLRYGTPLVTKIQDTQRHVQNTQRHVQTTNVTFKPPTSRSNHQRHVRTTQRHVERFLNVTSKDFSTSRRKISQRHVERFLNVTSKDFSTSRREISQRHVERFLNVTSRTTTTTKKKRTVDVAFKTLKKVIAVQLSRAQ